MLSHRRFFALLLIIALAAASAVLAAPDSRTFVPVQNGFTRTADEVIPYVPGRVLVKFRATVMEKSLQGIPFERGALMPGARTGIATVDAIAAQAGVRLIERPFEAEARLESCHQAMADPAVAADHVAVQGRLDALTLAQEEVDRLYARWAELEARVKP